MNLILKLVNRYHQYILRYLNYNMELNLAERRIKPFNKALYDCTKLVYASSNSSGGIHSKALLMVHKQEGLKILFNRNQ